ncbi:MAG: hypothetical protein ABIR96_08855 [Bdellovibrionota bacterium]
MMSKILKRIVWSLGVCGIVGLGLSASSSSAKGSSGLFPSSSCPVDRAMENSRDYFESQYSLIRIQGIFPWPDLDGSFDINGIWMSSTRGTYAVVSQIEHADSPRYGALSVKFFAACSHELLAEGTRILTRRDWNDPEISVSLKNYKLKGSHLRAYIRVVKNIEDADGSTLEIQIREARFGTRDRFSMEKFE